MRVLEKKASDGLFGEISVDAGGRSGGIWSSNQTAFKIGSASEGLIGAFCPHQIIKAMVYYGSAHPGMAVLRANFFQDPRPPETVSDLIKLGVSAEIVFFDLLLEDLSRASK